MLIILLIYFGCLNSITLAIIDQRHSMLAELMLMSV